MKKVLIVVAAGVLFSCTNDDGCHECHIAWVNSQNQEVEVEIGEKCGTELSEIESEIYEHCPHITRSPEQVRENKQEEKKLLEV